WAAERAVFVCDHQRRYCTRRALLSRSNTVIHNGVDTDYFQDHCNASERQALRATLGYAPTDYVIGSAAALRPEKNHVQLVEATARLRGAGLGAKALLIGDGPTRAAVEGRARAMGVERDVTVTGFREDVRPYLAACDVVCVSSLTEALSLAAIEAMAMGKPLVHSEVGGARELVDPGSNGLLFPAGDTAALVQCLARLADPATRESMGRCARVRVETDFGEEGMIDRYERLLLSVCGAARAARTRPGPGTVPAAPRPVVFLLGPRRDALSGVSTHLNLLLGSPLAEEFALVHFEVGSEGRNETALGRAVRLIASPLRLGAALLSERAAIVHLNTALTGRAYWRDLAYAIVARLCGAHVLHQIHGGPVPQAFCRGSRAFAAFVRATLRLSDAIVAGYRSECEAFRDFLGSTPVFVFPNAVDHEAYATLSHSRPSQGPLRLLFMGRLIPEKGLAELFEALALTTSQCVETRLVVAGTGPAEARLRALAAAGGLAHVQFVGPVRGLDKMSLLEWADVFVLPTYHAEGLPYALLESMAAGLAVIAT
ncbi:MAG TPA: glycosyltransferase, partial [Gemmatimonadales bacterium]|nr:glycosyltransferase [Gemmatimonadales bacterium]